MFPPGNGSKPTKSHTTLTAGKCNVLIQALDDENENGYSGWKTSGNADASHTGCGSGVRRLSVEVG